MSLWRLHYIKYLISVAPVINFFLWNTLSKMPCLWLVHETAVHWTSCPDESMKTSLHKTPWHKALHLCVSMKTSLHETAFCQSTSSLCVYENFITWNSFFESMKTFFLNKTPWHETVCHRMPFLWWVYENVFTLNTSSLMSPWKLHYMEHLDT